MTKYHFVIDQFDKYINILYPINSADLLQINPIVNFINIYNKICSQLKDISVS